ncbi:MAG: glycosyltransferase [Desulfobacterales bacterium]|nr:glycosyltransferase [Desulfobacterales bacterium]
MNKKPIRILRIIARLNVGGPAIQAICLSKKLSNRDFQTLLVCGPVGHGEGDMSYLAQGDGVQPLLIAELCRELSPIKDLKSFFKLRRIIMRYKPHIIHTHTAKAGTLGRLAAMSTRWSTSSRKRIKLVHTFHGHVFNGYFSPKKTSVFLMIERTLARITDTIVAISDSQKKELSEQYRIALADRIRKVELGFNLTPFLDCRQHIGKLRRKIGVDKKTVLIGIIGRLVPIKNHRLFLESVRILIDGNPALKLKFLIVGDGELKESLKKSCLAMGINSHVVFLGWIKDVSEVYADLNILALTSINEGTPVSIIEGMASSVPVVATDAGGVKDLLGKTIADHNRLKVCEKGLLCPQNDPGQFAVALEYQLKSGEQEKGERVAAAQDFVVRRYSDERLVRDIEALYLELLGSAD